jgi:hypothetical protein
MYDKSMFYDTNYHLNDQGRRRRTEQLIDLLKPYVGATDKVKNRNSGLGRSSV